MGAKEGATGLLTAESAYAYISLPPSVSVYRWSVVIDNSRNTVVSSPTTLNKLLGTYSTVVSTFLPCFPSNRHGAGQERPEGAQGAQGACQRRGETHPHCLPEDGVAVMGEAPRRLGTLRELQHNHGRHLYRGRVSSGLTMI